MDRTEIIARFTYYPPDESRRRKHELIRQDATAFALDILDHTSPGREQSLALTRLEEVMFWSNASIARNSTLVCRTCGNIVGTGHKPGYGCEETKTEHPAGTS